MRSTSPFTLRIAASAALGVMLVACTSATKPSGPGVANPERQSDAEYDLARESFQKGDVRVAVDHIQKSIGYNEENDKAHYLHAVILLSFCTGPREFEGPDCRLGDVEKAARAALKANTDFRDAKNLLGQVLINEKKYKDAIAILDPLTKDPAYIHPYFAWGNLGWAQVLDGQIDAGISSLRNSVAEPRFCVGHYRLGIALEKKNDFAMAEQSFSSAMTADPQCAELQDAWESRARVRVRLGKAAEAREDYEHCVKISKETSTGKVCVRELAKMASASPPSSGWLETPCSTPPGRRASGLPARDGRPAHLNQEQT
ncbi:MAG: tetratricopeptide repeat protein [Labilithrix sp.]